MAECPPSPSVSLPPGSLTLSPLSPGSLALTPLSQRLRPRRHHRHFAPGVADFNARHRSILANSQFNLEQQEDETLIEDSSPILLGSPCSSCSSSSPKEAHESQDDDEEEDQRSVLRGLEDEDKNQRVSASGGLTRIETEGIAVGESHLGVDIDVTLESGGHRTTPRTTPYATPISQSPPNWTSVITTDTGLTEGGLRTTVSYASPSLIPLETDTIEGHRTRASYASPSLPPPPQLPSLPSLPKSRAYIPPSPSPDLVNAPGFCRASLASVETYPPRRRHPRFPHGPHPHPRGSQSSEDSHRTVPKRRVPASRRHRGFPRRREFPQHPERYSPTERYSPAWNSPQLGIPVAYGSGAIPASPEESQEPQKMYLETKINMVSI